MIEHVLADEGLDEDDVRPAPKLMEVVLQNCRGRVDGCVAPYLTLALRRMDASGSAYMQVWTPRHFNPADGSAPTEAYPHIHANPRHQCEQLQDATPETRCFPLIPPAYLRP